MLRLNQNRKFKFWSEDKSVVREYVWSSLDIVLSATGKYALAFSTDSP